jgi:hypothetical protein
VQPLHSLERQLLLAIVPFDDAEKHPALEHLGLEVGGVLLPRWHLANAEPWVLASLLLRVVGSERATDGFIHQGEAAVREGLIEAPAKKPPRGAAMALFNTRDHPDHHDGDPERLIRGY